MATTIYGLLAVLPMTMNMTSFRLRNISIALFLLNCGLPIVAQTILQPEAEQRQSIASRAAEGKADGKQEVSFPSGVTSYPVLADGLTHATSEFTVVVGVPRAIQNVVEDDTSIATWYSIAITEVIASHPCKMCPLLAVEGIPASLLPNTLLPVADHSMLFLRRGGSVTRDGVKVTETENHISALTIGKKYVFVVDKSQNGIARLVLNDGGIFMVEDDGKTLTSIIVGNRPSDKAGQSQGFPTLDQVREAAKGSDAGNASQGSTANR